MWIDAEHMLGPDWLDGPLLVRPRDRVDALKWGEGLAKCGGFALVVLAGVEPRGTEVVRIARAVHEGGGALVALTTSATMAALRVVSRFQPRGYEWTPGPFADPAALRSASVDVSVRAPGWSESARVVLPVMPYDLRLSLDPGLVDRRGVDRSRAG